MFLFSINLNYIFYSTINCYIAIPFANIWRPEVSILFTRNTRNWPEVIHCYTIILRLTQMLVNAFVNLDFKDSRICVLVRDISIANKSIFNWKRYTIGSVRLQDIEIHCRLEDPQQADEQIYWNISLCFSQYLFG